LPEATDKTRLARQTLLQLAQHPLDVPSSLVL